MEILWIIIVIMMPAVPEPAVWHQICERSGGVLEMKRATLTVNQTGKTHIVWEVNCRKKKAEKKKTRV